MDSDGGSLAFILMKHKIKAPEAIKFELSIRIVLETSAHYYSLVFVAALVERKKGLSHIYGLN